MDKHSCLLATIVLPLSLVGGFLLGVGLGWVVWPVDYVDTEISDLKAGYQDDYILMVADAYMIDRDLSMAKERLARLDEHASERHVAALARAKMRAGEPVKEVRSLVTLAEALGAASADMLEFIATETPTSTPLATDTPMVTTSISSVTATEALATEAVELALTPIASTPAAHSPTKTPLHVRPMRSMLGRSQPTLPIVPYETLQYVPPILTIPPTPSFVTPQPRLWTAPSSGPASESRGGQ